VTRIVSIAATLVVCASLTTTDVFAGKVNYQFSGEVGSSSLTAAGIDVGDVVSGSLMFDPDELTLFGTLSVGTIYILDTSCGTSTVSLDVDGLDLSLPTVPLVPPPIFPSSIIVGNDRDLDGIVSSVDAADYFAINYEIVDPTDAAERWAISLTLADTTGTLYSDESVPMSLNLADFDSRQLLIIEDPGLTIGGNALASIDSLVLVPEPSTLTLLAIGMVALLALPVRSRRI